MNLLYNVHGLTLLKKQSARQVKDLEFRHQNRWCLWTLQIRFCGVLVLLQAHLLRHLSFSKKSKNGSHSRNTLVYKMGYVCIFRPWEANVSEILLIESLYVGST